MNRRDILTRIGGIGTAAVVAGGGTIAFSGSASAQQEYSISDADVTLPNGEPSYVAEDLSSTLTWDGFDVPVKYLEFVSEIQIPDQDTGWHELNSQVSGELPDGWSGEDGSDGWGGDGEYVVDYSDDGLSGDVHTTVNWNVVGDPDATDAENGAARSVEDPAPWQDELIVDEGTETFTLEKRSTTRFLAEDEEPISDSDGVGEAVATAEFDVTVTNEEETTGGTSDGDSTVG